MTKEEYLIGNMVPITLASQVLEILLQKRSHLDYTISHSLYLTKPLFVQGRVVQDLGGDSGTMDWRVGVERSYEDLDLRIDALLLLGRVTDDREGPNAFAIQSLAQ